MSIGPMGMIGSLAGGQLAQSAGSDTDRTQQEIAAQARESKSAEKAELAAGVGQTTTDTATSDRDADGRRLWEPSEERESAQDMQSTPDMPSTDDADARQGTNGANDPPPPSEASHGKRGANLDLCG